LWRNQTSLQYRVRSAREIELAALLHLQSMSKTAVAISSSLMFASTLACKKAAMPEAQSSDVFNHVSKAPATPPVNLVHGAFKVVTFTKFEFEVPAHSITPRLEGSFESALATQSAAPGNIDLLIMTPAEFDDFTHGHSGTSRYSVMGSLGQTIAYELSSTLDSSQKYFVVFRNPADKASPRAVKADLTASF
jgi:hypothetical protein